MVQVEFKEACGLDLHSRCHHGQEQVHAVVNTGKHRWTAGRCTGGLCHRHRVGLGQEDTGGFPQVSGQLAGLLHQQVRGDD